MSVIDHYQDEGSIIIGLTATPERLDGKGLGDVFDAIVEEVTVRELIDSGHLADYEYFAPHVPDLDGVKKTGGDYNRGATAKTMNKPSITGDLIAHYSKHLSGKRALVFAAGVKHSQSIVECFVEAGVPTAHLDAKTPTSVREAVLASFGRGDILVVSNVDLFDEGFDVPECQGVLIARPTASFVKHRQMIGRCLRPKADESNAVILDHAGNFLRHGMPDDITEWDLADKPGKKSDAPRHKQCPVCFAVLPMGAQECTACGHIFGAVPRSGPEFVDGDLSRVKQKRWTKIEKRELYTSLMAKARAMGYKPGWAKRRYRAKVKVWPRGFVGEVDEESFDACQHIKLDESTERCKHCSEYCGPEAANY
ncbi:MAG: hypothetical protein DRH30_03275 [Deltaproteobacteria bacterium]|nr:MAG: hypothetical protein DRH30_03275 [Deltaproteobacteria bacterium]